MGLTKQFGLQHDSLHVYSIWCYLMYIYIHDAIQKSFHLNIDEQSTNNFVHAKICSFAGLSDLSFDPRPEIRKSALQVLSDTLRNHGHLFSLRLWEQVFDSVLFPLFDYVRRGIDPSEGTLPNQELEIDPNKNQDARLYETCTLSLQLVVDLFVKFYDTVSPLLKKVLMLLISFIMRPHQILAGIGITALVRLMSHAGGLFSEDRWLVVVCSLKEASKDTLPDFSPIINEFDSSSISRSYGHSSTKPGVTVSSTAVVVDENVDPESTQSSPCNQQYQVLCFCSTFVASGMEFSFSNLCEVCYSSSFFPFTNDNEI